MGFVAPWAGEAAVLAVAFFLRVAQWLFLSRSVMGRAAVASSHGPAAHRWQTLEKLFRERLKTVVIGVAESEKAEGALGPHGEEKVLFL